MILTVGPGRRGVTASQMCGSLVDSGSAALLLQNGVGVGRRQMGSQDWTRVRAGDIDPELGKEGRQPEQQAVSPGHRTSGAPWEGRRGMNGTSRQECA